MHKHVRGERETSHAFHIFQTNKLCSFQVQKCLYFLTDKREKDKEKKMKKKLNNKNKYRTITRIWERDKWRKEWFDNNLMLNENIFNKIKFKQIL